MRVPLQGHVVFISASVPDPQRRPAEFDAFEVTEAVTALTSAFVSAGADIVTAAHPTIAPLIITVVRRLPDVDKSRKRIRLYQSEFFRDQLPKATIELMRESVVEVNWTETARMPDREASLYVMRHQMFREGHPSAAVFIGGMEGIREEYEMLEKLRPGIALYPICAPGGAAANLPTTGPFQEELRTSRLYPYLGELLVEDLAQRGLQGG